MGVLQFEVCSLKCVHVHEEEFLLSALSDSEKQVSYFWFSKSFISVSKVVRKLVKKCQIKG